MQRPMKLLPTRALGLLLLIGAIDLITTAALHRAGMISEMNPVMRVFLDRGTLPFVLVKGTTLCIAWYAMVSYAKTDLKFVRKACLGGSFAYLALWCVWFFAGNAS